MFRTVRHCIIMEKFCLSIREKKTLKCCRRVISMTIWVIWTYAVAEVDYEQFFSFLLCHSTIAL